MLRKLNMMDVDCFHQGLCIQVGYVTGVYHSNMDLSKHK